MNRRRHAAIAVVLYTREPCQLCVQAHAIVQKEARGCALTVVDIDRDDTLIKRYGLRIPVVTVDGEEVAEGQVATGAVRAAVKQADRVRREPRTPRWRF